MLKKQTPDPMDQKFGQLYHEALPTISEDKTVQTLIRVQNKIIDIMEKELTPEHFQTFVRLIDYYNLESYQLIKKLMLYALKNWH